MIHNEKKIAKIIEELTIFFFGIGSNDITSKITKDNNEVLITFKANYNEKFEQVLPEMERLLKSNKNDEMEDIYWELAGSGDPGETSQLLLIGMMVDEATVERENDYVIIKLIKNMTA